MLKYIFILLVSSLMLGCATPKPVELPKQNNPLQLNYHPSQPFPFTAEQLLAQLDQLLALQPEELTRQNIERIFKVDLTLIIGQDGVARSVAWEDETWFYALGHEQDAKGQNSAYFWFLKALNRKAPPPVCIRRSALEPLMAKHGWGSPSAATHIIHVLYYSKEYPKTAQVLNVRLDYNGKGPRPTKEELWQDCLHSIEIEQLPREEEK